MNALFCLTGYDFKKNQIRKILITVPDGAHDRYEVARELVRDAYSHLSDWNGQFVCLTKEEVWLSI